MIRMRTISEAYKAIKESDPETALNPHAIRRMILHKQIPYIMSGSKYLLNLDALEDFLKTTPSPAAEPTHDIIRCINS